MPLGQRQHARAVGGAARGHDHHHLVAAHHDAAGRELPAPASASGAGALGGLEDILLQRLGVVDHEAPRPWEITPARSSTARKRLADSREEPASCARSAWVAVTSTSLGSLPGGDLLRDQLAAARPRRGSGRSGRTGARGARWSRAGAARARSPAAWRCRGARPSACACRRRARPPRSSPRSPRRSPSGARPRTSRARRRCRPGPNVASVIVRPSAWVRIARACARRGRRSRCRWRRPRGTRSDRARSAAAPPPGRSARGRRSSSVENTGTRPSSSTTSAERVRSHRSRNTTQPPVALRDRNTLAGRYLQP